MSRLIATLLGIIAVAVVAITILLAVNTFSGDEPKQNPARIAGEKEARHGAEYYCTLGGVVPGMTGLDDPAYLICVERETKNRMEEWDVEH